MKYVLVVCEFSQRVTESFRNLGAAAFSCDLIAVKNKQHPEWHIVDDATKFLDGCKTFRTQDGHLHKVPGWNLIICHPPCTYLCKLSSVQLWKGKRFVWERWRNALLARRFFYKCLGAPAKCVCVENPLPMARVKLPHPTTYVQPWEHGDPRTKKTLLWLKNLPPLLPTKIVIPKKQLVHSSRGKYRSITSVGIARAMANQWYNII